MQRPLLERAGMSVRAYLRLLQLVLNKRHRLQEIGSANRLCALVAVQDGTEARLDRTLDFVPHRQGRTRVRDTIATSRKTILTGQEIVRSEFCCCNRK